ncbi:WD40-repeat-containing domain protein [Chaetomium sp. MPI-CAGE-AT-0009]|nr:WD40-repeat-containing domain protein [Chaetomium sp. MPI-CAGE-AT-0009]
MDRTAASARQLTESCISKFKEMLASQHPRRVEFLESRLADFNLWADGVGALAKVGASLDSRLRGRENDLGLVKTILIMLADSLDYYAGLPETDADSAGAIQNLDSAIKNLAQIGVAIRRTGKASRNRRVDQTFNPDEYQELRKHLECVVLLRPTEEGLFRETEEGHYVAHLDASKLSDLQKRLIEANLRRRHNFLRAQKHCGTLEGAQTQFMAPAVPSSTTNFPGVPQAATQGAADPPDPTPNPARKGEKLATPTISGSSLASTAEGTLQYAPAAKRYTPGAAKTQITFIASDVEFPQAPSIPSGQKISRCPCCCQSLPVETFREPKIWKQHVVEELCPYTCIADNCPTPQLLFCTRNEWESHVRKSHLPRWQCPLCEEQDEDYQTMESMRNHFQTDHKEELLDNSLSTLLSWSAVQKMGIITCPLCSSHGPEDSPELVDHVLRHAYEFALRALPWPPPVVHDLNVPPGSFNLPVDPENAGYLQQWINGAVHESAGAPGLQLCHYDREDHAAPAPTHPSEDSDYFRTNRYFEDLPEDKSSRQQIDQSIASSFSHITVDAGSPGAARLASASHDDTVKIWNPATGQCIATLNGHMNIVRSVAWSPDAAQLVSGSDDKSIKIWDPATGQCVATFSHNDCVSSVAWSPDAVRLASASYDKTIKVWDLATKQCIAVLNGHRDTILSVTWSPDAARLASASYDQTIKVWDLATKQCIAVLNGHRDTISSVAWSPNAARLASASHDNTIKIWDPATVKCMATLNGHEDRVLSVAWSPDTAQLASASRDKTVKIWHPATGQCVTTLNGHNNWVSSVAWSDAAQLASASRDDTVKIWDPATGQCVATLNGHTNWVLSVAWSRSKR